MRDSHQTERMKVAGNVQDSSFLTGGFSNWQDAIGCFSTHRQPCTKFLLSSYMAAHYSKLLVTQGNALIVVFLK